MLFNSLTFAVFFAVVLLLHNLPFPWPIKKLNLLVASYLFYAAWNPPFVILLWLSTVLDWYVARALYVEQRISQRRMLLAVSMVGNLGLLGFFKYGDFLLRNWAGLMDLLGVAYMPPKWDIILPVGHLVLHLPDHGLLARRVPAAGGAGQVVSRLRALRHLLPPARGRPHRPADGPGAAVRRAAAGDDRPGRLGAGADDPRPVQEDR